MDLSYHTFQVDCEELANSIRESGNDYVGIICVARGGLFVGGQLSHLLGIRNITSLAIRHYSGSEKLERVMELSSLDLAPSKNGKFLLVDDLIDSGDTMEFISGKYSEIVDFDIAVLYDKGGGSIRPDFCIDTISKSEWVTFPWEMTND